MPEAAAEPASSSGISPVVTGVLVLVAAAAAWLLRGLFRM
jgi:hypothetical protein